MRSKNNTTEVAESTPFLEGGEPTSPNPQEGMVVLAQKLHVSRGKVITRDLTKADVHHAA